MKQKDYENEQHISLDLSLEKIQQEKEKEKYPWLSHHTKMITSPIVKLHNEIIEFYQKYGPSEEEIENRYIASQKLIKLLKQYVPEVQCEVFGSTYAKIFLKNSDIDIVILDLKKNENELFYTLENFLKKNEDKFDIVKKVEQSRVKVIKFIEIDTNYVFDVSFNQNSSVQNNEFMLQAIQNHPEIKYLIVVMKTFLRQRNLNQSHTGGMGSFLLFCILYIFLETFKNSKCEQKDDKNCLNNISLAEYLMEFLRFIGDFDFDEYYMDLTSNIFINKKQQTQNELVLLEKTEGRNIGKNCFRFNLIKKVFRNRYYLIMSVNFYEEDSILKQLLNPSDQIFDDLFNQQLIANKCYLNYLNHNF